MCLAGGRRAKSGQDGWDQVTKDLEHQRVWTLSSFNQWVAVEGVRARE